MLKNNVFRYIKNYMIVKYKLLICGLVDNFLNIFKNLNLLIDISNYFEYKVNFKSL